MRRENRVNQIRRQILSRYIEVLVGNGHDISYILGKPLSYWGYETIVELLNKFTDKDFLWVEKEEQQELSILLEELIKIEKR